MKKWRIRYAGKCYDGKMWHEYNGHVDVEAYDVNDAIEAFGFIVNPEKPNYGDITGIEKVA